MYWSVFLQLKSLELKNFTWEIIRHKSRKQAEYSSLTMDSVYSGCNVVNIPNREMHDCSL